MCHVRKSLTFPSLNKERYCNTMPKAQYSFQRNNALKVLHTTLILKQIYSVNSNIMDIRYLSLSQNAIGRSVL